MTTRSIHESVLLMTLGEVKQWARIAVKHSGLKRYNYVCVTPIVCHPVLHVVVAKSVSI